MSYSLLQLEHLRVLDRSRLEDSIRARTQFVYLGNGRALCRTLGRYKFFVHTDDVGFASHVLLDGFWEIWLTQFIARHITPGQIVIDVGANFGYYTLLLADLVGDSGQCIAVEPNLLVARELEASIAINGFARTTTISRTAAGDGHSPTAHFYIPHREPKNARVVDATWASNTDQGAVTEVPTTTIDELSEHLPRVDFLKIDAEGAEEAIFRGMSRLLTRNRPDMILEFNAARYDARQFLGEISRFYPSLRYLDFDGQIKHADISEVISSRKGEDWLLFLSAV
jgi:FkbM family methyltransferase